MVCGPVDGDRHPGQGFLPAHTGRHFQQRMMIKPRALDPAQRDQSRSAVVDDMEQQCPAGSRLSPGCLFLIRNLIHLPLQIFINSRLRLYGRQQRRIDLLIGHRSCIFLYQFICSLAGFGHTNEEGIVIKPVICLLRLRFHRSERLLCLLRRCEHSRRGMTAAA